MDSVTKETLLNLLRNVRTTTDEMWHGQEMTWRIYAALIQMFPDQFLEQYQSAEKHVSFRKMHDWRSGQIRTIEAATKLVESWK
jgi:hypothetical protein